MAPLSTPATPATPAREHPDRIKAPGPAGEPHIRSSKLGVNGSSPGAEYPEARAGHTLSQKARPHT